MSKLEQQLLAIPALQTNELNEKVASDVAILVQKIITSTDTKVDNRVIDELKSALDKIDTTAEPTDEETFAATLGLIQTITQATPTNADDVVTNILSDFVDIFGGESLFTKFREWVLKIRERRAKRKAAKEQGQ